ncbi:PREDICTED: uncharacterized protein LOC108550739 [Eufriesea mexicana]|uniref:uncharacterized protein LOC108550739 n=1 Tax=Eufriesea mexicana TaxID=516756 RepID=UPI00083C6BE9|nr:PREDICTED: uncharacterized protein LOC108550739 [Eufriesea mexicana]
MPVSLALIGRVERGGGAHWSARGGFFFCILRNRDSTGDRSCSATSIVLDVKLPAKHCVDEAELRKPDQTARRLLCERFRGEIPRRLSGSGRAHSRGDNSGTLWRLRWLSRRRLKKWRGG